jgi:hypothetical protein
LTKGKKGTEKNIGMWRDKMLCLDAANLKEKFIDCG